MSWLQEPIHRIEALRTSWHNRRGEAGPKRSHGTIHRQGNPL